MPGSPHERAASFSLSNEQTALYVNLCKRNENIAQIYLGAVLSLKDQVDPERLFKVAYEMRELMVGIPDIVDSAVPILRESLGPKVHEIDEQFRAMLAATGLKPPEWKGALDDAVRQFLNAFHKFSAWKSTHLQRRADSYATALKALDGPGRMLPQDVEAEQLRKWMDAKEYFDKILHRGSHVNHSEVAERVAYVEMVLMSKLNPKTFAAFDAIDEIIRQGESQ